MEIKLNQESNLRAGQTYAYGDMLVMIVKLDDHGHYAAINLKTGKAVGSPVIIRSTLLKLGSALHELLGNQPRVVHGCFVEDYNSYTEGY